MAAAEGRLMECVCCYQYVAFTVCLIILPVARLSAEELVPLKIDYHWNFVPPLP